ncbi:MAG: flagellar hook-associated protein FlgK [Desulfuromonadales bacterium]|nr:flagellar hook-associated protein FlgK [Desulfuromonadales bacterium]MDW7757240.1 flagellar hook-associated protein FlgK [Desulfuromonadales bacterium]
MGGLLNALNAGKTSLFTNQKGIEVTGNNMSNVNTEGYSRQIMRLSDVPTLEVGGLFIGNGVRVDDVVRQHDQFIQDQLVSKQADFGFAEARSLPLTEVERIMKTSEQSLSSEIDAFFDAWQELSTNPSGEVERQIVIQRGETLAQAFQDADGQLQYARENINTILEAKVVGINETLREIAELNERIAGIEAEGRSANSARDRRDLLVQDAAALLGAQTLEQKDGTVSLQLPGGLPLVQGRTYMSLETERVNGDMIISVETGATKLPLGLRDVGGEIKGLLDVRDEVIPDLMADLDKLAYNLVTEVNAVHEQGLDRNGDAGGTFFEVPPAPIPPATFGAGTAGNMLVRADLVNDTSLVAAGTIGGSGDNTNALDMVKLHKAPIIDGADSFAGFYSKIAGKIGIEINRNTQALEGADDARVQLQNLRDSKVGVSVEEEMLALVQYQAAFEAAAKFLTTVDEMMATVLNMKR